MSESKTKSCSTKEIKLKDIDNRINETRKNANQLEKEFLALHKKIILML